MFSQTRLRRVPHNQQGASALEYVLLASLVAVVFVAGATLIGNNLQAFFDGLGQCLQNGQNCPVLGGGA
jgi:Flp pilus assembly pilin Flp